MSFTASREESEYLQSPVHIIKRKQIAFGEVESLSGEIQIFVDNKNGSGMATCYYSCIKGKVISLQTIIVAKAGGLINLRVSMRGVDIIVDTDENSRLGWSFKGIIVYND